MKRRIFLMASTTTLLLPMAAQAYSLVEYSPATWEQLKQTEQTVILNFRATWSHTCNEKLELMAKLMAENTEYNTLSFVNVDWDTFGQSQFRGSSAGQTTFDPNRHEARGGSHARGQRTL